jgi:hypothetical protein
MPAARAKQDVRRLAAIPCAPQRVGDFVYFLGGITRHDDLDRRLQLAAAIRLSYDI